MVYMTHVVTQDYNGWTHSRGDSSRTQREILKGKIYEVKPLRTQTSRYTNNLTRDARTLLGMARWKRQALHPNIWGGHQN